MVVLWVGLGQLALLDSVFLRLKNKITDLRHAVSKCFGLRAKPENTAMPTLEHRPWVPEHCETLVQRIAAQSAMANGIAIAKRIGDLVDRNRAIHER